MCKAIVAWKGLRASIPKFRIHGDRDFMIPLPAQVDCVIEGGHLIAMTKARECLRAIQRIAASGEPAN